MVTRKKHWLVWALLTAVTLFLTVAIAVNAHPALRGPVDWRWVYAIPGRPARHLIGVVTTAVYGFIIWRWGGTLAGGARRPAILAYLLFCAASVPVLQISLLAGESPDVIEQLYFRTVSAGSSGFFSVGSIIDDPADFVARYPELMPTFPVHPQRYPPGIPLLFYAGRAPLAVDGVGAAIGAYLRPYQCTDLTLMRLSNHVIGTALWQMLLPLFSALVIFPLFGLARRTMGWQTAVWSAALYPLIPSFALWAGRWDQFFPVLTVTAWYLLVLGLTERRHWALLLAGVTLALATMLSFGLLVMLAPMGLWALLWLAGHGRGQPWPQVVIAGGFFGAGLALVWGAYQALAAPGLLDVWRVSMGYHLGLARSYWTWLGYHLYDFGVFLGLPVALLCLFAFFYALLTVRHERMALPIAFGLGVCLLDLSGTARGEVARVWLFLTPFAVIGAAWGLTRLAAGRWPYGLCIGLLGLQLLTFNAFLRVVNTGLANVPTIEITGSLPLAAEQKITTAFGDHIYLRGYNVFPTAISPGGAVSVTLYWQTNGRLDTMYTVFNHLINAEGELAAQQDGMPLNNTWPTTCWRPGEMIADTHTITIDHDTPPGTYTLFTGLYMADTGVRLPVGGQPPTDALILGMVEVVRP